MKPWRRLSRSAAGVWPAAWARGAIALELAVWSFTIILAKALMSGFFDFFSAIWAAWISYMSDWLALDTKAAVSCGPRVLAEVAPTAAPVASSALFTAWPAATVVSEAVVLAGLLQAANERAATAAALKSRACFMALRLPVDCVGDKSRAAGLGSEPR